MREVFELVFTDKVCLQFLGTGSRKVSVIAGGAQPKTMYELMFAKVQQEKQVSVLYLGLLLRYFTI